MGSVDGHEEAGRATPLYVGRMFPGWRIRCWWGRFIDHWFPVCIREFSRSSLVACSRIIEAEASIYFLIIGGWDRMMRFFETLSPPPVNPTAPVMLSETPLLCGVKPKHLHPMGTNHANAQMVTFLYQ